MFDRGLQIGLAAAGGIAFSLIGAPATAGPVALYSLQGSFTPIGDAPNVQWTPDTQTTYTGTGSSLHTTPGPNVLVDLSDSTGVSLVNLPADLVVSLFYQGYLGETAPAAYFVIQLVYDDPATLFVDGSAFHSGAVLASFIIDGFGQNFTLAGGSPHDYALSTILQGTSPATRTDGTFLNSPGPTVDEVPYSYQGQFRGFVPYAEAGVGQLSGTFTADSIPEPSSWALMILGFAGLGARVRRRTGIRPALARGAG